MSTHPNAITIGWIYYGVEIYQNVLHTKILDNYSESIYPEVFKKKSVLKIFPTQLIKLLLLMREKIRINNLQKVLQRIDLFCHWNKHDYERIRDMFPMFTAKYIPFGYNYSFSELKSMQKTTVSELDSDLRTDKIRIMIGHGASISLNHLTILEFLRKFGESAFDMICPVSYGDMDYKKLLVDYAKTHKIGNLTLLEEFIPFQDYAKFLSTVDILVMNNIRAQGGSNIALAFEMGIKVYMNSLNTHYWYFTELGFKIHSTSDLLTSTLSEIIEPLSLEDKTRNRTLINNLPVMNTAIYVNLP